jgi:SAM-dependent methyltransferase
MGARVTGVDFSDKAILEAQKLAAELSIDAAFICSDVYNTSEHLSEKFDIVYTTYGTIGWLPDLDKWAKVISERLNLGGKLIFVDFHPVVWMFDDDFKHVAYNYFKEDPIIEEVSSSYANKEIQIMDTTINTHPMSRVHWARLLWVDTFS